MGAAEVSTGDRRSRRARKATLLLLALAALLWWTEGDGRRMFLPRNFGVVEEAAI
jgi:hypothetical protein